MKEILEKSFDLSIRAIELVNYLDTENRPFPLSGRFLECATGIGLAMRLVPISRKRSASDRASQALAYLTEVEYLLELMVKTGYLNEKQSQPMKNDCRGLGSLITERLQCDLAV